MPYHLFRTLCSTLEIRADSEADRDRALYESLRIQLAMGAMKPKEFFSTHPDVSEADVLKAFLSTLEPFALMVETVYQVCSHAPSGATGGQNITVQYSPELESLEFDLDAFLRYQSIRSKTRVRGIWPKFHSDFSYTYSHVLQEWAYGADMDRRPRAATNLIDEGDSPTHSVEDLKATLDLAEAVGRAHLRFFDAVWDSVPAAGDYSATSAWLRNHSIDFDHPPQSVERWAEQMRAGISAIPRIEPRLLVADRRAEQLQQDLGRLRTALNELHRGFDETQWADSAKAFLDLPYWKKRWQLYEVWIFALTLERFLKAGGRLLPNADGKIVLTTGASSAPAAVVEGPFGVRLEAWFEFEALGGSSTLRPDIAIVLAHDNTRFILRIVECKQRANVSTLSQLDAVKKYLPLVPPHTTNLVVNYDPFTAGDGEHRIADESSRMFEAVDRVAPGDVGLSVLERAFDEVFGSSDLNVLLLDTTGSMHGKLEKIAAHIESMPQPVVPIALAWFADHQDPYLVKLASESMEPTVLATSVRSAERTSGGDVPEALEDALRFARDLAQSQRKSTLHVTVFTDAPAHTASECPNGISAPNEVAAIVESGGTVTIVACDVAPEHVAIPLAKVVDLTTHTWPSWDRSRAAMRTEPSA